MTKNEKFIIQGLAGKKLLTGSVKINGAKNAALKAMAAAILFDGSVTLKNIPNTDDIETMTNVLVKLGAKITWEHGAGSTKNGESQRFLTIDTSVMKSTDIDCDLARSMRASVVLTGPLLARFGKATFPAPGGCVIGARPIDLFLSGYEKMGATVNDTGAVYDIKAEKGIAGAEITFNKISVGATETLMMAATLAKGKTTLKNCALEPEIVNVAEWLNSCGADINGVGTPTIHINGTGGKLLKPKHEYVTIPDRIEAGSYLILGALAGKDISIENCRPDHLETVMTLLKNSGANITVNGSTIKVSQSSGPIKPFDLQTHEYPGFPTDLQAPMVVYLTQAHGESTVVETIFEGRFKYTDELVRMGADIKIMNPREILVKGPTQLKELPDAEELAAHDIRAGFAVVMAAVIGKGNFVVNNVHLIDRGYEKLESRLKALGAEIRRV